MFVSDKLILECAVEEFALATLVWVLWCEQVLFMVQCGIAKLHTVDFLPMSAWPQHWGCRPRFHRCSYSPRWEAGGKEKCYCSNHTEIKS